jgi:hypothetical protein
MRSILVLSLLLLALIFGCAALSQSQGPPKYVYPNASLSNVTGTPTAVQGLTGAEVLNNSNTNGENTTLVFNAPSANGSNQNSTPSVYNPGTQERLGGAQNLNVSAAPTTPTRITCSVTVSPQMAYQNAQVYEEVAVYSDAPVNFTFNCGNQTKRASLGGLSGTANFCTFSQPGNQTIWVAANGNICANTTVDILPVAVATAAPAQVCTINPGSISYDLSRHIYSAIADFSGFGPSDILAWTCGSTVSTTSFVGSPSMPSQAPVYCIFSSTPSSGEINVTMGGVSCGSIPTP